MKLTFIFFLFFQIVVFSQNKSDIITKSKKYINDNNFSKAEKLLSDNYDSFPHDLEYVWLYAYTSHKAKNEKKSLELYDKAISISPENMELKLEYARMLYEIGKLSEAEKYINILKTSKLDQSEILLLDASIQYWKGNFSKAEKSIEIFNKKYPKNVGYTKELSYYIKETKAPFIQLDFNYASDNQPLETISEQFTVGQYRSAAFFPILTLKNYNYNPTAQVIEASLSNTFQVADAGFSTKIEGGIYYNQILEKINPIGEVIISKNLSNKTNLKIGANRKPYIATQISTTYDLLQNNAFAKLEYGKINEFYINATYNYQFFEDNNNIQSFGIWGLTKPLFKSSLKMQLGYGFSYSDAKTTSYKQIDPLQIDSNSIVKGEYTPYYTPDNQLVNSAVVVANYNFNSKFKVTLNGTYGFYAKANVPQFKSQTSGNIFGSNTTIVSSSVESTFNPFDIGIKLGYNANKNLTLSANLSYFDTYFYDSLNSGVSLKYNFF
jgi:Tfp pilus assembly protein PilF